MQAKGFATDVAARAKGLAGERLAKRTSKSAGDLVNLADALRITSRQLEGNFASPTIKRLADRLERMSEGMSGSSVDDIARKVETFARREPLLFAGGALALGVLGARFLKSSALRETTTNGNGASRARGSRRSRTAETQP